MSSSSVRSLPLRSMAALWPSLTVMRVVTFGVILILLLMPAPSVAFQQQATTRTTPVAAAGLQRHNNDHNNPTTLFAYNNKGGSKGGDNNSSNRRGASIVTTTKTKKTTTMKKELFKAGLFVAADVEEKAAVLASKRVRSLSDLGWAKEKENRGRQGRRRSSSVRPKFWAWGGSDELALQDKPNYDPNSVYAPDPWLSLERFYTLVKDDTAAADAIFVALAGGRAFCERNVAQDVLEEWWGSGGGANRKKKNGPVTVTAFDKAAFFQTVKRGQQEFILQWVAYLSVIGFAALGIVFPTNPVQLALVGLLEGSTMAQ